MKYLCKRVLSIVFVYGAIFHSPFIYANEKMLSQASPAESVLPVLGGLIGILLLIFFLAALVKKFSAFNLVAKNIKVIDSQNLGAKERLVIVEIQNKQIVLGVTQHNVNQICELEQPIEKKQNGLSFDAMMKQFLNPQAAFNAKKEAATKMSLNKSEND